MKLIPFPKVDLGFFPTPISELTQLSKMLDGPDIFIKRDDLTGLAFGGNKTRKLEFIMSDAIEKQCDTVITAGAAQSNHCRQTAAAAAQLGMACHLVLGGEEPNVVNGNLLLDNLLGAKVHWAGNHRKGEDISKVFEQLKAKGKNPYVVPYGGSNELGAYAFIHAMGELKQQIDTHQFSHIVFASSSGGTHAGMVLGKTLLAETYELIGIAIDKEEMEGVSLNQFIPNLANRTANVINEKIDITANKIVLNPNYIGDGYGVVGDPENEAISLLAKYHGILLDPVYTGRAMAGLIDMIRSKQLTKEDRVLFWHTGGSPALFAYANSIQS